MPPRAHPLCMALGARMQQPGCASGKGGGESDASSRHSLAPPCRARLAHGGPRRQRTRGRRSDERPRVRGHARAVLGHLVPLHTRRRLRRAGSRELPPWSRPPAGVPAVHFVEPYYYARWRPCERGVALQCAERGPGRSCRRVHRPRVPAVDFGDPSPPPSGSARCFGARCRAMRRARPREGALRPGLILRVPFAPARPQLAFSTSPLTWTYSVGSEVFALNNFFAAALVWLAAERLVGGQAWAVPAGAFLSGLALCNQHTIILFEIPLIAAILWAEWPVRGADRPLLPYPFFSRCPFARRLWSQALTLWRLASLAQLGLLGLAPYAYLPLSQILRPHPGSWGDVASVAGFVHHLRRGGPFPYCIRGPGPVSACLMPRPRRLRHLQALQHRGGHRVHGPARGHVRGGRRGPAGTLRSPPLTGALSANPARAHRAPSSAVCSSSRAPRSCWLPSLSLRRGYSARPATRRPSPSKASASRPSAAGPLQPSEGGAEHPPSRRRRPALSRSASGACCLQRGHSTSCAPPTARRG